MSALFGHVKGAFTGANSDRPGLLKSANNGMLFLDEIGELGLDEQAMILRAIEEKRFLSVGSDKETVSSFQLVAGTNRDLSRAVTDGRFREDLLARLNLWTFELPGLKDRREDKSPTSSSSWRVMPRRKVRLSRSIARRASGISDLPLSRGNMVGQLSRFGSLDHPHGDLGSQGPHHRGYRG